MPVFISHCHRDVGIYTSVCYSLDNEHIPRWDVALLKPGSSLADQLRIVIEQCEVCIFLATGNSVKSTWCLAELGAFWGAGKTVIIYLADATLTEAKLPVQFRGYLTVNDTPKLIKEIKSEYQQTYDIFLAVPMASYDIEEEYQSARLEVLKVCEAFRNHCNYIVYCAVEHCPTMKAFETASVSVKTDLKTIRKSNNFVMIYPRKILSSILFEAGFAMTLRKYSVYFATNRNDLPYLMRDAANVFPDVRIEEIPCSSNYDSIVETIRINKRELFLCEYTQ